MASERKFYKTTVNITILSEGAPADDLSMDGIGWFVTDGEGVLHSRHDGVAEVSPEEMARLLDEAGSDPGFFSLTPEGDDEDQA